MCRKRILLIASLLAAAVPASAADMARLTLFNQGAALVTEHRSLRLQTGEQSVAWPGLPRELLAETLTLTGADLRLTGYRDSRDLLRPEALWRRLVGETVTLRREDGEGGDVERRGVLLSAGDGAPVVRMDDRLEVLDARSPWRIAAPWPKGLPETPALTLDIRSANAGTRSLTLTYQTGGLGWSTEYVARYDEAAESLALQANALVRNQSGGGWNDAELTLVAGEIARAADKGAMPMRLAMADAAESMAPESGFEYYRYRLPSPVTLRSGETLSLALLDAAELEVESEYRIEGGWQRVGDTLRANAAIRLSFDNKLDRPLPAGTVRVYDTGRGINDPPQLLGEDRIGHTPEGVAAALTLGRAFDITAERTVTEESRNGTARESERRIVVSNAKDEPVKVRIVESLPGDWEILSQNLPHRKMDANRASWVVGVPANGKARLSYRVRWR